MVSIKFKRGDTFVLDGVVSEAGQVLDITGWTVKSQVRLGAQLLAELQVQYTDRPNGKYRLLADPVVTATWPVNKILADVEYTTAAGQVVSTETFEVDCQMDVTRA